ncbi:DUF2339 domain-containing protein [Bernardetia sp.]|uniref:DUF2339 domain-containing protein n=1 Tax=Bernardetia sp. TaxID=1937974 RepID=UPI0025C706A3|nr:DUF2339 domain-containing protein [Bernardetia sp.]
MDDKNNPKKEPKDKQSEDNFDENDKFPNQNLNQIPKNLVPKRYTSAPKKTEHEESDLLKVAEGFREEIQETRSYLRRFDKEYEEFVKKDPIYHHLSQMSDLTIEDDELAQRIYKNKIKEYKGMREGARKTGDMVGRGRRVYLKVFGEDEQEAQERRAEPDARYQPKKATLQQQTRTLENIYSQSKKGLEEYLGENLLNKVGIIMLVVGIIMLINFGIDAGFIGNIGQLFIGFTVGGILVGLSHHQRNSSKTLSATYLVGGMIILYYSATLLFEYYSVGSQIWAYAINLLITLVAVVLAIAHDRKTLALVSIIGGYVTAFVVVGFETTNYFALFTYLLLLNIIALGIAYKKEWNIINIFTFFTSLLLFDIWVFLADFNVENNVSTALIFSTLYYVTFFLMNIVYSMGTRQRLKGFNYTMLLANVISYVVIIFYVLYQIDSLGYLGAFIFGLAVFNSIYSYLLYKSDSADVKLFYTVVGYTIAFFTIAIPLLVDKEYINVCFVFEGVILIWVGVRSQMSVFKTASMFLIGASIFVWFLDLYWSYENDLTRRFLLNGAVLSSLLTMVGLAFSIYLLKDEDEEEDIGFINIGMYTNFLGGFMLMILFFIGNLELIIHKANNFGSDDFRLILIGLFNIVYAVGVWQFAKTVKWNGVMQIMGGMVFLMTFVYLILVQPQAMDLLLEHIRTKSAESHWLTNSNALSQYLGHYINLFVTIFGLVLLARDVYYNDGDKSVVYATTIYILCFAVVAYSSLELRNTVVWLFYDMSDGVEAKEAILETNNQFGYPILWALLSIAAISLGLRYKIKEVRLFALILFVVLLIKFFLWDFWHMGRVEGIITFVIIGAILLRIGYKYNRLRKLIMEDELQEVYQNTPEVDEPREAPTGRISSERRPSHETKNRKSPNPNRNIGTPMSREDKQKERDELSDLPPPPPPRKEDRIDDDE